MNVFRFLPNVPVSILMGMSLVSAQQAPPQFGSDSNYPAAAPEQAGQQDNGVAPTQIDSEDRNHGVARISLLNGDVSVRRGDSGDTVAASVNTPLLAQDAVIVGQSSRAELQFDTANRVRFADDTEARISQLTADHFQIQVARGTVTWAVLSDSNSQAEMATPSVAVRPLGRGDYRVSVLPDGTSQITVRAGMLEIYTPRGVERVQQGQTMLARGAAENPEFQVTNGIARDDWDAFNERRDRELQSSPAYNYVSRDIAGAEDLGNYGQWNTDPTYGQVWTPRVSQDWAPYRLGRWGYEDYYGWTWISSDPWGWAPYHYGSWFQGALGWSWCPGPRYGHYFYRPALVGFVGFGVGGGLGFGFGNVGWVPLAPFERFHPWYGRGYGYGGGFGASRTFVSNVNITNIYRNARVNNGVTSISSRDFASGNFGRYSSPSAGQLRQAGMVRGSVPFTPTNNHLRFNDRQSAVQPRANFGQTQFASHMQTSSGNFGRQTSLSAQTSGGYSQQRSGFNNNPQANSGSNWNRFGSPARGQQTPQTMQGGAYGRQPAPGQSNSSSSWQRFGAPSNGAPTGTTRSFSSNPAQGFGRSGSASVQVAPPVVQQRGFSQQQQPAYNRSYSQQGSGFGTTNNRPQPYYQPGSQQPSYRQPSYRQPSYNQPSYNQPRSSQPSYSQPSNRQPSYSQQSGNRPSFTQSSPSRLQPSPQRAESQSHSGSAASSNHSSHESNSHGHR